MFGSDYIKGPDSPRIFSELDFVRSGANHPHPNPLPEGEGAVVLLVILFTEE